MIALARGVPRGNKNVVKMAIFGLTASHGLPALAGLLVSSDRKNVNK